jgi:hypothetical protein
MNKEYETNKGIQENIEFTRKNTHIKITDKKGPAFDFDEEGNSSVNYSKLRSFTRTAAGDEE